MVKLQLDMRYLNHLVNNMTTEEFNIFCSYNCKLGVREEGRMGKGTCELEVLRWP